MSHFAAGLFTRATTIINITLRRPPTIRFSFCQEDASMGDVYFAAASAPPPRRRRQII